MYEYIRDDLTTRIRELRLWIDSLDERDSFSKVSKGLVFVYLYGIWESVVKQVVVRTIDALNASNVLIENCIYDLYSMAFFAEYDAIYGAGSKTKWEKRWAISSRLNNSEVIKIPSTLIPTDGRNIQYAQLKSIAMSFGIKDDIVPRPELGGRLKEVVNNRNWMAHGDKKPADVGANYSMKEIKEKINQIEELAIYIITVYENYIIEKKYLRS